MKRLRVGKTAYGIALVRTMEMYYPKEKRLFEDPYAVKLLPLMNRVIMNIMKTPQFRDKIIRIREKQFPGLIGSLLCRTVYIDDVLKESIKEGVKTAVNLGAGLDMRSLRIPEARNIHFYEVDEPGIQDEKKKRLVKIKKALPPNVTFIPVDFNTQSLKDELNEAGFSGDDKTLFIWEGVTQYISREAMENTLRFIGTMAKGSKAVFTYVLQSFLDDPSSFPSLSKMMQTLSKMEVKWESGFNPEKVSEELAEFNLRLIEDIGEQDYLERYMKPSGRDLQVYEIEHCVLAEVK